MLHHLAVAHDDDAVGHLRHHAHVVGDEDDGGAGLLLQVAHQLQDLRLDGAVERGGRLVGDQDLGIARHRHRDHDALAHAAGQLVRILLHPPPRLGDAHRIQHRDGALLGLRPAEALVAAQAFDHLRADRQHGIEAGHRLLEDHRDVVAADVLHLGIGEREQVAPLEQRRAGGDPSAGLG